MREMPVANLVQSGAEDRDDMDRRTPWGSLRYVLHEKRAN